MVAARRPFILLFGASGMTLYDTVFCRSGLALTFSEARFVTPLRQGKP